MRYSSVSLSLLILLSGLCLAAGEKVVCASYSSVEPKIDGVLDDECWKNTMFVSDFTYRATDNPLAADEKISMGIVFTERFLCVALRADIRYPKYAASYFTQTEELKKAGKKNGYRSKFSAEVLFSPRNILSSKQTWQILADSFNDFLARHSVFWEDYPGKIISAGTFDGKCWNYELMMEYPGFRAGDIVPFNVMINEDAVPFANWQNYETALYIPSNMVGRILFGTPEQLKKSDFLKRVKEDFAGIRRNAGDESDLKMFFPVLEEAVEEFEAFLETGKTITTHGELSEFMSCFNRLNGIYHRLKSLYEFKLADKNKQGEEKGFFSFLFGR